MSTFGNTTLTVAPKYPDPSTLPGLLFWFDASDTSTLTVSGGRVSQWNDKSGNGYNATQATPAGQPYFVTSPNSVDPINALYLTLNYTGSSVTAGTMILATRQGTAAYTFKLSAGSYKIGKHALGLSRSGDAIVGQIATTGSLTQTQITNTINWLCSRNAGNSYSSVTNFGYMWAAWAELVSFPLIDTSAGTNFNSAWSGCSGLTSFPLINTSAGTDFTSAWNGCSGLTSFPTINTSAGTNFNSAWSGCSGLTSFPTINTSAGTNFTNAWYFCTGLTSFPLINVSSGTNFTLAWRTCNSLSSFPANFFNNCAATNFTSAFGNTNLSQTSIDNILVSINSNNTSSGTFGQSGGSYPSSTGLTALLAMLKRGWNATATKIQFWDSDGVSPLGDGAGSWNASGGTNWVSGTSYGAWTSGNVAVFGVNSGAAGTITVGTPSANGIVFLPAGSGNYTLSGGTLALSGTTPTIEATVNATISSVLAGTAGLVKIGAGTLSLSGVNTYTGATSINAGTLQLTGTGAIASASNISVASGAVLDLNIDTTVSNAMSGSGIIRRTSTTAGTTTITGNNASFTGSYEETGGAGYFAFASDGSVGASNVGFTFSGATSGFYFTTTGNTLTSTRTITLSGGTVFYWNGVTGRTNTIAAKITGNGSIANQSGELHILTGSINDYTGYTAVASNGSGSGAPDSILRLATGSIIGGTAGSAVDSGNILFNGTGTNAVLEFNTADNLGVCSQIRFRNSGGTIGYGGCLRYIGSTNETVSKTIQCDTSIGIRLESNSTGSGSVTFSGGFSQTNRSLWLGGSGTGVLSSVFSGSGTVTKRDAGTWTLSGANTYTGATSVTAGTLVITKLVSGPAKFNQATFTNTTLTVDFSSAPVSGETYRILPGATTQTYSSVTLTGTGVAGITATYNSSNSTLTIA